MRNASGQEPIPDDTRRAFAPPARRVLIIGLDGATFDVLNPLMAKGRMPRLAGAIESGASGTLYSTVPPITPAAWTTFLTGRQPGSHRILDFEGYDVQTGRLQLITARRAEHLPNLWRILSDKGFRVGSINVPMTYPPRPVNGFIVTGFETPGPESEFAYPPELKAEILARWPDPTLKSKWEGGLGGGDRQFARNLAYLSDSFHQGAAMTAWLGDRFGWDVLMVVLKLVDNLQHKTWKYLDPRWSHRRPARCEMAERCFEELDRAVGDLLDYATCHDATVLMVSDHGHGSLEGRVFPNRLLEKWGYLKLQGRGAQVWTRMRRIAQGMRGKKQELVPTHDVRRHIPVDLSRTRACVMHAGNAAFVYVNLKGRQPTGIVEPEDYEKIRDELIRRFTSDECTVESPRGDPIALFPEVYKPEELYGVSREDEPWLPDLLLIQHEVLAVVRRMHGGRVIDWLPYRRLEGTHRKEGVLIATGPGIARRKGVVGSLVDCAPTILSMLGLRIPADMQGRVIRDLFATAPVVETEGVAKARPAPVPVADEVYTAAQLQRVTERLSDLGYLE